jgi:DNA-binding NtrC family response regulator
VPKQRILIIDDEAGSIEAFRAILKDDYDLLTATSGQEGLKLLQEGDVQLVLLDIIMPEMDGLTVLRKIREMDSSLTVVMVTATKSIKAAVEAMKLGAFDYMAKPFEVSEAKLIVQKAMQSRALHQELKYLRQQLQERGGLVDIDEELPLPQAVEKLEREMITRTLDKTNGVLTETAKKLGITRRILKYKMDTLGITKL